MPIHSLAPQAVGRLTGLMKGPPIGLVDDPASAVPAGSGSELRLRSNFTSIMQPGRGGLAVAVCAGDPRVGGAAAAQVRGA